MILSFPHMGKLHLALEKTCELLSIPCIVPSKPGPKALQLGQELAPEGSCLPFCLVLGNMREALEEGADAILMLGGSGPCRFGYFVYLAVTILQDAGYRFKPLIIDRGYNLQSYLSLKEGQGISLTKLLKAARFGWNLIAAEEMLDRIQREYRPLVWDYDAFDRFLLECRQRIERAACCRDIQMVRPMAAEYLQRVPELKKDVVRVGLVGDIYTLLEPYANFGIEEFMRENGVVVHKEMSVSGWLPNILLPWRKGNYHYGLLKKSYPYLQSFVGGFGLESVANAQQMKLREVDGIIQIFPMGCMPEIVARSALGSMARERELPVLSITMDQHHSETGFKVRLEAFLDMLICRKKQEQARKSSKQENNETIQNDGGKEYFYGRGRSWE